MTVHVPIHTHLSYITLSRIFLFISILLFVVQSPIAQRPHYTITAVLDTSRHLVSGVIDIHYTNRSEHSLDSLGIHLWPNAYSSKSSALVKQMLHHGNTELYHARLSNLGGLSGLHFTAVDYNIKFYPDHEHIDIGWLLLDEPLLPGKAIHISSPYTLQVPASFSRLGRTGHSYQMTQWYPHLAVFDAEGWHMMPYLDYGEYFNDFADYKVIIHTPPGYKVAATGTLVSSVERETFTEWVFHAENVIDFAWFASSTFIHERLMVDVGGSKKVELNIYSEAAFHTKWQRASAYASRALQFYSEWLGPYPYPQMSVVSTPWSQAGFMEYPMVAQIGLALDSIMLDQVIAHEIGHTWLYGVLANDERTHPWLDEGLNSFIEKKYLDTYHPRYDEPAILPFLHAPWSMQQYDVLQHMVRFNGDLQPPASHPEWQKPEQYLFSAYLLPMQGLQIVESMKGEDQLKEMFRQYYADHQFTHVTPLDLKSSFEKSCSCDLSWFFEGWIYHAHEVDYRIRKFIPRKKELILENKGSDLIPVQISSYKRGKLLMKHWMDGFPNRKIIHLDKKADEVRLFDDVMVINKSWRGNIKPGGLLPRIRFLPSMESYASPALGVTPFFGYNLTDGIMPGVAITSGLLPQHRIKWILAPMVGIESGAIRGHGEIRYVRDLPNGFFSHWLLSLSLDHFGYHQDTHYGFRDHYVRWSPALGLRIRPGSNHTTITQWLKYRYVDIGQFYGRGINYMEKIFAEEKRHYAIHELAYQVLTTTGLNPFSITANVQGGENFLRFNLRYKMHVVGQDRQRGVWIYGYGGWLPVYDQPKANVLFTFNGLSSNGFFSRDYMFDEWLGGRNADGGIYARQVFIKDAGLKTLATIGLGDQWMLGNGISVSLPFKMVHVYMDAALYHGALTDKVEFSYSGGVALVLLKDVFEIYVPFLESKDIRESLSYVVRDRWFERIAFQANFKLANPLNLLDRYQLGY